ncbi:MAG TPA: hypothetical protein DCP63_03115 [Bacteroidetes bacterium]|nr:hypothetical protein [Bacteroidota bacterium]
MNSLDPSRRDVLKLMGLGTIALTFSDFTHSSQLTSRARIGLQLYTLRREIEHDFEGALRKVAAMGFLGIEYYPLPENITTDRAGRVFKDLGLQVLGMHTPLPVGEHRDAVVKMSDTFHCDRVIYPGWPEGDKYKDVEAMGRTAELFDETSAFLRSKGLRFGLHNHWWEFEKSDGIYPFYFLLEHLQKEVFFEIDTYWAKTAGHDPAEVVRDFGRRAPLLHIKDGPAVKGETMYNHVPAGDGTIDFHAIAKAGGKNTEWMIVEFDEYGGDIFDAIKKSYTFLTKNGLAEGRA